jgi:hypothetical protein
MGLKFGTLYDGVKNSGGSSASIKSDLLGHVMNPQD